MLPTGNLDPRVVALSQFLQERYGLKPTSSYRGVAQNDAAGGAKGSQHLHGRALDYSFAGLDDAKRAEILKEVYGQGVTGVGLYGPNADKVHFDFRDGPQVIWGNGAKGAYRGMDINEAAPWARDVLMAHYKPGAPGTTPTTQTAGTTTPTGGLLDGLGGGGSDTSGLLAGLMSSKKTDPNAALLQSMMAPQQQQQPRQPQVGELLAHWGQMPMQYDPQSLPLLKSFGA